MFIGADPNAVLNTRVFGFRDVLDGLSQTAMVSEKVKGTGGSGVAPLRRPAPTSNVYYVPGTVTDPRPYFTPARLRPGRRGEPGDGPGVQLAPLTGSAGPGTSATPPRPATPTS